MKRILVFGGNTGIVATQVANRLATMDGVHPVFADTQKPTSLNQSIEWLPISITDMTTMAAAVNNADAIVSCVESNPDLIQRAAVALFSAIKPGSGKRVVLLSSMAVYGAGDGVFDEHATLTATDDYAAARIQAEARAKACGNCICLRSGVEYGPGSTRWSGMIAKLLMSKRLGDLGAAGDGYCNLLFMNDLVDAVIRSLQLTGTQHQVFNLSCSERITWNDYLIRYGMALGAVPVKRIGHRRLRIEARMAIPLKIAEMALGESNAARLRIPVPMSPSMIRTFNQRILLDVSEAEKHLGMQWTPLQNGLKAAVDWVLNGCKGTGKG